jgi:hypothetical protein
MKECEQLAASSKQFEPDSSQLTAYGQLVIKGGNHAGAGRPLPTA